MPFLSRPFRCAIPGKSRLLRGFCRTLTEVIIWKGCALMDNIFVLVNPVSANGTTRDIWPQIAAAMEAQGLTFEHHMTTAAFQAPAVVRNALKNGNTTIVSVGGDGTVNEVVNGFFEGEKPINPQARLGIISRGTGCDLIKTLGIPKVYQGAVAVIAQNREKPMDLVLADFQDSNGVAAQRWFANIADSGLGATVANRVNHTSKSSGGFFSFLFGTLWSILTYKNVQARVDADGDLVYEGSMALAAVANGRYFGGGMLLVPQAHIDDGAMDLVVIRGMTKLSLLFNLARIYKGTHLTHPKISLHPVQDVRISSTTPLLIELDGEVPGTTPVRYRLVPGALRVLC